MPLQALTKIALEVTLLPTLFIIFAMLTIRLSRTGKRKQPYYRIVLQEKTRDPWSPAIEVLGQMNPRLDRAETVLDEERIKYWLSKGAEVSKGLHNLFVDKKLLKGKKVNNISLTEKRRKAIEAAKPKAEAPAEQAAA